MRSYRQLFFDVKRRPKHLYTIIIVLNLWFGLPISSLALGQTLPPADSLQPEQITSEIDPILHMAVSPDGEWVVYASSKEGFSDLWLRSAKPSKMVLPRQLTFDPADESNPAFSPDGRFIVYTGNTYDVKGDLFLLSVHDPQTEPIRLTGRDTEDGSACFSKDGKKLYFHQAKSDDSLKQLVMLDLTDPQYPVQPLTDIKEGAFPKLSPDGSKLAYISYKNDPLGNICLYDLKNKKGQILTQGPYMDFFPAWSPEGTHLFFSRIAVDTDKDGRLSTRDNAVIYKIRTDTLNSDPFPVTRLNYGSFQAQAAGDALFFLSDRGGVSNCWKLPLEGAIPLQANVAGQLQLAQRLEKRVPADPFETLLAYYKILERFPEDRAIGAQAAYTIGVLWQDLSFGKMAAKSFAKVTDAYRDIQPYAAFARIQRITVDTKIRLKDEPDKRSRQAIVKRALTEMAAVGESFCNNASETATSGVILGRALVERARLLILYQATPENLLAALKLIDQAVDGQPDKSLAAEALILKAEIYQKLGRTQNIHLIYLDIINNFAEQSVWSDKAVDYLISLNINSLGDVKTNAKIEYLRNFAEKNREINPKLCIGALNRIGDLYYNEDKWAEAKAAYYQVLKQFPQITAQTTAARLALAEILYKEERFRQALDLYETEISQRPSHDAVYQLARNGYIQKSIASGEFLFQLGEVLAARKTFKELLDYDQSIVEAHRGYIKCAAALNNIKAVIESYRQQMAENPKNPVLIYATALALTYLNQKPALLESKQLLLNAIALDGRPEYFHQTLGYVYEVSETVYQEKGTLALALEAYKKAYFLNDHANNRLNAANLLLNLGNTYFVMKKYGKAFTYFEKRLESQIPFDNGDTEMMFYRRLGIAAYQSREKEKTIEAFEKALALIQTHMDPRQTTAAFDNLHRYVMDNLLIPSLKYLPEKSRPWAKRQSDLHSRLSELSELIFPPPEAQWYKYKDGIKKLLEEQKSLFPHFLEVHRELTLINQNTQNLSEQEVHQALEHYLIKIERSLRYPERLTEMKIEMLDRLGLAFQEAEQWKQAAANYHQSFELNRRLKLTGNLATNKRQEAYATYRLAEASGEEKKRYLHEAALLFEEAISLVKAHGVAGPKQEKSEALISLSFQVALDSYDGTQAVHGFTAQQEKRLAEAFLTKIHIELGELAAAEKYLNEQLENYPLNEKAVAGLNNKNVFGVSLLYHQAGLLAYANGEMALAFQYFKFSAELCGRMQTPISLALNVRNMAQVLNEKGFPRGDMNHARRDLNRLSRLAGSQLTGMPIVSGKPVAAIFHNAMGVYALSTLNRSAKGIPAAVDDLLSLKQAVRHFRQGLAFYADEQGRLIDSNEWRPDRYHLNMIATLNLNMAYAVQLLGENDMARIYFQRAFDYSVQYLLPDIKWRALVGLGRLKEALQELEKVTILRAGAQQGEIVNIFSPLVIELVEKGENEAAFNLAERISELERFNRLAFTVNQLDEADKRLLTSVYKHYLAIRDLKQRAKQKEIENNSAKIRIKEQMTLLETKLGPDRHFLPEFIRQIVDPHVREQFIIALGVALDAEKVADLLPGLKPGSTQYEQAHKRYRALTDSYHTLHEEAVMNRPLSHPADIMTFLGPEAVEAIDVMENLPADGMLLSLFPASPPEVAKAVSKQIIFKVTPEEITAVIAKDNAEEWQAMANATDSSLYVACPEPAGLTGREPDALALSATHLMRSVFSRKPFKKNILTDIPDDQIVNDSQDDFVITRWQEDAVQDIWQSMQGAHTVLLGGKTAPSVTIPTRTGENARTLLAYYSVEGRQLPLERLFANAPNVSLALLAGASSTDAYFFGHLFSILGCPSIILPKKPNTDHHFINAFIKNYPTHTAAVALQMARKEQIADTGADWMLLGYRGLSPEAAGKLARKNFFNYIKQGQQAFKENKAVTALAFFENAVAIAETSPTKQATKNKKYDAFMEGLYHFSRESAYTSHNLAKAEQYAHKLASYLEQHHPDTEKHAESLLRLGLIQAQRENYEAALPNLEMAVEMFANLELDAQWVGALSNFGIILENATEYDRALGQFKTAAKISQDMDQQTLVARQYVNIGRINDLRMNRYALAIQNYKKALAIYRQLGDAPRVAQAQLDMGRCYRLIGNFRKADEFYQAALHQLQAPKDTAKDMAMFAKIVIEQANNAWFQGRYEEAFQLQRKAYKIAQTYDLSLLNVITLNTSGLIWWTLGNQQKAMLELTNALKAAKNLKNREDEVASTLNNIGLVHRENGRYQEALESFNQALVIDKRLKSRWAMAYDYRNKGLTYLKMGAPQKALPLFEEAYELAHAIGNRINEAKALLGLGETQLISGHPEKAMDAYQKALDLSKAMSIRETQWRAIFGLAKLRMEKDPLAAIQLLYDAVNVIETLRSEIKIAQLKDSFVNNKLTVYQVLITLLADQGKTTEAFEIAERSRGRNFIDLLGNQQLSLNRDVDQVRYDRQLQLKSEIREYEALIAQASEAVERDLYKRRLTDLTNEFDNVMLEIQSDNPQLASIVAVEPLDTDQLLGYIEPEVALLSYYVMPREIFCWVLRNPSADGAEPAIQLTRTPLSSRTLGKKILNYRRLIQNLEPLAEQSQEIYQWLLQPVVSKLEGIKQLGIIPHGQLHYLSFATLADKNAYLIDRYALFYLPSASVLKYTISKRKSSKKNRVLAIGNPDLGDPSLALPFAEYEVNSIKWNFPDITILTREKATESWVAEHINQFGIIHIASHGEFNPINPLFSAIKLSKAQPAKESGDKPQRAQGHTDGDLEAAEVFSLNINADVVILSACQTGLGNVQQGDDVIGLNRAFFYAGTHTIISSLWRVSDISTAILLKQFYRQYLTMNKAESLRQATLHVKQRYVHPGYWGAFTLVGDYF